MVDKNPRKRYLANVNPKNLKSIRFFENNGFKKIQHTFELSKELIK
jgi:RimJ/RimL family protein N-acetyltransferase